MTDDLVKRLRKQSSSGRANHLSKADRLTAADRIEELEAKLFSCATDLDIYMSAHAALEAKLAQQDDLVQAAVAAALERAADLMLDGRAYAVEEHGERSLVVADMDARHKLIRNLASDTAEVAAIIKAAGEDRG